MKHRNGVGNETNIQAKHNKEETDKQIQKRERERDRVSQQGKR